MAVMRHHLLRMRARGNYCLTSSHSVSTEHDSKIKYHNAHLTLCNIIDNNIIMTKHQKSAAIFHSHLRFFAISITIQVGSFHNNHRCRACERIDIAQLSKAVIEDRICKK